jgi:glycosyltransferase involved in cell wall biosynthesis
MLKGTSGDLRREFEKLVDWTRREPPPDVVSLPNSLLIAMAAPLAAALDRPVCCTLQGEELFLNGLTQPYRDDALALIRRQVATVDRFIAVSDYGARFMSELLDVAPSRMAVVPLGVSMAGYEMRPQGHDSFTVGYFARVAPEKGLHLLVDAFVRLARRTAGAPVRLEAAGYLSRAAEPYLDAARRTLAREGLADRFTYRGEVDRAGKLAFLRSLDVLSVPATYDEPKGMFLLEAMASGVPVVQPRRGAFVEIVERTGGGLLVDPDSAESLADGLYALWRDRDRANRLGRAAFQGVRAHYTIEQSARRLIDAYADTIATASAGARPVPVPVS